MKNINEKYSELCANHKDYEQFKTTTLGNLPKEQFDKIEADYAAISEVDTPSTDVPGEDGGDKTPDLENQTTTGENGEDKPETTPYVEAAKEASLLDKPESSEDFAGENDQFESRENV